MSNVMLTTQEAATRITSAIGTAYTAQETAAMARLGVFPGSVKVGNEWRIPDDDVDQYISHIKRRRRFYIRWGVISVILSLILAVISATADAGTIIDRYLFPTPTLDPTVPAIADFNIYTSSDNYKFEIIVNNPTDREVLVKKIEILYEELFDRPFMMMCAPPPEYIISDKVEITEVEGQMLKFKIKVQENRKELYGYHFNAYGEYGFSCGGEMRMYFNTALILEKNKYNSFYIVVPRNIHVTWPGGEEKYETRRFSISPSHDYGFGKGEFHNYLSFKLSTDKFGDLDYGVKLVEEK